MIERGNRDVRTFGLRRAEEPSGPEPGEARRDVRGWPEGGDGAAPVRTGPLAWALRTAALAGLVALFATQYLVRISGPGEGVATRMAQGGRTLAADPETTGSIGRAVPAPGTPSPGAPAPSARTPAAAAQATRLDPCMVLR